MRVCVFWVGGRLEQRDARGTGGGSSSTTPHICIVLTLTVTLTSTLAIHEITNGIKVCELDMGEIVRLYSIGVLKHNSSASTSSANRDDLRGHLANQISFSQIGVQDNTTLWYGFVFESGLNYWNYKTGQDYFGGAPNTYSNRTTSGNLFEASSPQWSCDGWTAQDVNRTGEGCYLSYWYDQYAVPIEPHFASWTYNPFTRPLYIAALGEGRSAWQTSSIASWGGLPYIGGFVFLRDATGKFIGLGQVAKSVDGFERMFANLNAQLLKNSDDARLYVMTAIGHQLVIASVPGVSRDSNNALVNATDCVDPIINQRYK